MSSIQAPIPGILCYTLLRQHDKPPRILLVLYRDTRSSRIESTEYYQSIICPYNGKIDSSALDSVTRGLISKTDGIFTTIDNDGALNKSDKYNERVAQVRHKLINTKYGVLTINKYNYILYVYPVKYIDSRLINDRIHLNGSCVWIYADELLQYTQLQASSNTYRCTTIQMDYDADEIIQNKIELPLYLPFDNLLRDQTVRNELIDLFIKFQPDLIQYKHLQPVTTTNSDTQADDSTTRYRIDNTITQYLCSKCRTVLFTEADILPHKAKQSHVNNFTHKSGQYINYQQCTSYFTEPLPWCTQSINSNTDQYQSIEHKINCYKCKSRIGTCNWSGTQCSCGQWIVPAFQFVKSKVDARINNTQLNSVQYKPKLIHGKSSVVNRPQNNISIDPSQLDQLFDY